MTLALLLSIHFHEPRYHGNGAWPPAPMRLFQALVAGAAEGARLPDADRAALQWLERLQPPEIVAPPVTPGLKIENWVPNNDLDALDTPSYSSRHKSTGAPIKTSKGKHVTSRAIILSGKTIQPQLFGADAPVHYFWMLIEDCDNARQICALAERLHHLGRGVDPAWCEARILPEDEARDIVAGQGIHHRPSGDHGVMQAVPIPGTLRSLERRFAENRGKFRHIDGKRAFSQPPRPLFREVSYDAPPDRVLYEMRDDQHGFVQVPSRHALTLTTTLLKDAAARLSKEFPDRTEAFERLIVGRGADAADKKRRARLIPLPSIGSEHVDRNIRRVLLEIPQDCQIRRDTLLWAFDGLGFHTGDGVVHGTLLRAENEQMLRNYARASTVWQTETPAALPSGRRRLERGDRKAGKERAAEEQSACGAVRHSLRHAGIDLRPTSIEVRREPFSERGTLCNDFEPGRFDKHALWHVRLRFERPLSGPLLVGDGRFAGLGVMSPVDDEPDILSFRIVGGLLPGADGEQAAQALRRAVMARVQGTLGPRESLPGWFTGHETEGKPMRDGEHAHLAFVADLPGRRLLIVPPHRFDRQARREKRHLSTLAGATRDLAELRAGSAGLLFLRPEPVPDNDPVLGRACVWESMTPFAATRHPRRESVEAALIADALLELGRRGLPRADIEVLDVLERAGRPVARLRLTFATAQTGPILLGRTLHKGGGMFRHGHTRQEGV